jgi:hypothetical protein
MHRYILTIPIASCAFIACGGVVAASPDDDAAYRRDAPADDAAVDGDGPAIACAERAQAMYLITEPKALYRFEPREQTLTKVGDLNCPLPSWRTASVSSIAVDQAATVWLLALASDATGTLLKVDTADASCAVTSYVGSPDDLSAYTLTFASDGAQSANERLYAGLLDFEPFEGGFIARTAIGTIDPLTLAIAKGPQLKPPFFGPPQLAGTGDGRLFAYDIVTPSIAEIDKASGKVKTSVTFVREQVELPTFAFWGGDLYLFSWVEDASTSVRRFRYNQRSMAPVTTWNIRVAAAASSTCAPLVP